MTLGEWMEAEIRQQPQVLAANADRYLDELRTAFSGSRYEMVLLAARGSSDNAALYVRYLIEVELGIPVSLAAPSVLTRYGSKVKYPKCLAVGISQSGEAPDVSEVVAQAREQGHDTLAVTNTPGSRLTNVAERTLLLDVGEERSVAATKTYTATLVALAQLVTALGGRSALGREDLPDETWTDHCEEAASAASGPVVRSSMWFALGRGFGFSSAHECALKLMECALLPCKPYSTADFEHGPKALAGHGSTAVVFGEAPVSLEATGCTVIKAPGVEGTYSPVKEIVFGQFLALHAARARGLDPDRPEGLQKVTRTV
ncbi:MAG: SIS domain-containing protein [Armatimonadetes bacterium]|nr:SIS domain-containing protein [Armatimonadota bacterium]